MEGFRKENTRIAKNTLIFNVRMVVIMLIGILATRLLMKYLGASDYGLYNVVAGIIAMLGFLTSAMSATTRRYINIEQGKPDGDCNRIFNICMVLHIVMAIFILVLAQTLGLWYVCHVANIPDGKMADAVFVYEVSTFVACLGIVNIPYQSLIESHEQFHLTAIIDIVTNLVRLGLICLLVYFSKDGLRVYALMVAFVTLCSFVLYRVICFRRWRETVRHSFFKGGGLYKEMFSFNFYSALGALSSVARTQGSNLVVNFFFGTVVNAAFSIAYQIETFTLNSVNKLTLSAAPQITRNWGAGNSSRTVDLVYKISRFTVLIMAVFFFTAFVELDWLIGIWMHKITVPEGTVLLCRWTLVSALVRAFCGGGTQTLEQATGKIKWFQIWSSVLAIAVLPLGCLAFNLGAAPVTIILLFIGYSLVYRTVELLLLKRLVDFRIGEYFMKSYLRPALAVLILALYLFAYTRFFPLEAGPLARLGGIALTFGVSCLVCFFVGMYSWERESVLSLIKKK
ncbi:MAG: hypothetical protein IJL91_14950 [Bacteroidales bacterium]|nr:hypothetical protein [Bacteroidales bacterium]